MAVSANLPPDLRCRAGIEALAPLSPDTGRGFLFFGPLRQLLGHLADIKRCERP